jgi:hypothetical protein
LQATSQENSSICPLCGQDNDCALARTKSPDAHCWCLELTIPRDVRNAAMALGKACVCHSCATSQKAPPPGSGPK